MCAAAEPKLLTFSRLQTPPRGSAGTGPQPTEMQQEQDLGCVSGRTQAAQSCHRRENGNRRWGVAGLKQLKDKLTYAGGY